MMRSELGNKLTPVLVEVEDTIIESAGFKPNYPFEGFRAATQIFMSVLMDKIFELAQKEKMDLETASSMAESAGEDLKKLIKTYTNLDTKTFYK